MVDNHVLARFNTRGPIDLNLKAWLPGQVRASSSVLGFLNSLFNASILPAVSALCSELLCEISNIRIFLLPIFFFVGFCPERVDFFLSVWNWSSHSLIGDESERKG
jgi:hypothetical protein